MNKLNCSRADVSIASIQVVSKLDLEFSPGTFWAVLGSNGAGKTTLLNCLAGLRAPDRGRIEFMSREIHLLPRKALAQELGMLQQHSAYVFDSSVLQTALTGRHPHLNLWERESPDDVELARNALASVNLEGFEQRCVTSLSGGEARRLAFASLLVQQVSVMLLDEPTNHLDLHHQVRIMDRIQQLCTAEQCTAIAALHDINLVLSYCSHVLMLFGNGEWQAGTVDQMVTEERLERLYHCPVERVEGSRGPRFYPLSRPPESASAEID